MNPEVEELMLVVEDGVCISSRLVRFWSKFEEYVRLQSDAL